MSARAVMEKQDREFQPVRHGIQPGHSVAGYPAALVFCAVPLIPSPILCPHLNTLCSPVPEVICAAATICCAYHCRPLHPHLPSAHLLSPHHSPAALPGQAPTLRNRPEQSLHIFFSRVFEVLVAAVLALDRSCPPSQSQASSFRSQTPVDPQSLFTTTPPQTLPPAPYAASPRASSTMAEFVRAQIFGTTFEITSRCGTSRGDRDSRH